VKTHTERIILVIFLFSWWINWHKSDDLANLSLSHKNNFFNKIEKLSNPKPGEGAFVAADFIGIMQLV
jgi:hypothetical protein